MRNFIISLIIFLLWAFLGMWWYYSCPMCSQNATENQNYIQNKKEKIPIKKASKTVVYHGFSISNDIGADVFNFHDEMRIFNHKDSTALVHFPASTNAFRDSIFAYLNRYQNKELKIIGWYKEGEWKNHDENQNFGKDRANNVKQMLSNYGINPDRMSIDAIKEIFNYNNGHLKGGVKLIFEDIDANREAEIMKGITNKTLYTQFNSRVFKPDNTLKGYAIELKNYLAKYPNKKVKITGHTDNVGEAHTNQVIARDRAQNVMQYFIKQGIAKEKLSRFSDGETTPISDNTTPEGRALNRRIEIKVY